MSISACGSLKEELPPGHFVIVDQFIDRTFAREKSFFGPGCVAHVSMADPVSPLLADAAEKATRAEGIAATRGGSYLVMEGPQFSTRAESELYRSWGCSVIGMTNMPEAKLAREAEICYATVAMVTDYDCWHDEHAHVDVAAVIKVLSENVDKAHRLIERLARDFPASTPPAPSAPIAPSTWRSSPRPRPATRPCWRSSTRWRGGCWADRHQRPGPRHASIVAYARASASSAKLPTTRSGWCGVSPKGRLRRSTNAARMP